MNTRTVDDLLRAFTSSRLLIGGVCIGAILWTLYRFGTDGAKAPVQTENAAVAVGGAESETVRFEGISSPPSPRNSELDAAALERRIVNSQYTAITQAVEEAKESINSWADARQEWKIQMAEIADGNTGRILATDSKNLPRLMEIIRLGQERSREFSRFESQIDAIANDIERFQRANPDGEVTAKTRELISNLCDEVQSKSSELASALSEVNRRIDQSRGMTPGRLTLREAISQFNKAEEQKVIDTAIAAREQAQQEKAERILNAEREKLQTEAKLRETELAAETHRLKAELEQKQAEADRQRNEEEARVARAKLEADFARDLAEINSLLSPFVSRANLILFPPNNHSYSHEKVPVSLKKISSFGALDDGDDGLDKMSQLGLSKARPLGTFPRHVPSEWRRNPAVKAKLLRAQELLLKYGELLVEKGMLER